MTSNIPANSAPIIDQCQPVTIAQITVHFTTSEVIPADYVKHQIVPFAATLRYRYEMTTTQDGWNEHVWRCDDAKVAGWRVLKPGPNGEQRVSDKATHEAHYWSYGGKDIATGAKCQDFLRALVESCRPSGEVRILSV